jgi:chemotaxis protein methyltransferase CheR
LNDAESVAFLQWALPQLRMRWKGFRRVRRQVRRRINARLAELGLSDANSYRSHLEAHPAEWVVLDRCCRVTVSRFYRNRGVFDVLFDRVLPELAATRVWCAGCASGEEPYTISLGRTDLEIVATDSDAHMIERARIAEYPASSLRELPAAWRARGFEETGGGFRLRSAYRERVEFRCEDVRETMPAGPFDLILCRNFVFTYFEESLQRTLAAAMAQRLVGGGALLLGHHESLPAGTPGFAIWDSAHRVYRRSPPHPTRPLEAQEESV